MSAVNYNALADITFLEGHSKLPPDEIDGNVDVSDRIRLIATNIASFPPAQFKAIPLQFKAKILSVLSSAAQSVQKEEANKKQNAMPPEEVNIEPFLAGDETLAAHLLRNGMLVRSVEKHFLDTSENGVLKVHCGNLTLNEIQAQLAQLPKDLRDSILKLEFTHSDILRDLSFLKDFPNVKELNISNNMELRSLSGIEHCKGLLELNIEHCGRLENLEGIKGLPLTKLSADSCATLTDVKALDECQTLEELDLSFCRRLQSLAPIVNLSALKILKLRYLTGMTTLDRVKELPNLKVLDVSFSQVANIDGIMGRHLEVFLHEGCPIPDNVITAYEMAQKNGHPANISSSTNK